MKIAIVTLYGLFNYGNRLQNYALQSVLELLGNKVETLAVEPEPNGLKRIIKKYVKKEDGKILLQKKIERIREENFRKFTEDYIHTRYICNKERLIYASYGKQYDAVVVGSDQVWNPLFWEEEGVESSSNNYLLKFCDNKIAYASSFGIGELPLSYEKIFATELKTFNAISVREKEGMTIVNKLIQQKIHVVLDPTMLLSAQEWRKIQSPNRCIDQKYIVTYFLGEQEGSLKEYIESISKKNELEIINIMDSNTNIYGKGPEVFLNLIDNAELCFTDSFHATVFSTLFHTPFIVTERKHSNKSNMNSRITTLLEVLGLEKRMDWQKTDNPFACDFTEADSRIEREKKKSIAFLVDAIN